MESKNMTALESTGASSEIKEQYEKMKNLLGGFFYFLLPKRKVKEMKDKEACKNR
ncbi:MAG: hypothetical protein KAT65_09420 [Methanophagales archaeon]|nr:hypothetical protein [Methanophagales archaeon]